jgi:hypothetical protein
MMVVPIPTLLLLLDYSHGDSEFSEDKSAKWVLDVKIQKLIDEKFL